MIELKSVTFGYPGQTPVFSNFSWSVKRGEAWAVLGPSGIGKTTLLYLLAGLRLPNSGQILVDGKPVIRPRPQTGLILQDYGLLPWATVYQNAGLGQQVRNFYGPDGTHAPMNFTGKADIEGWLKRLGIDGIRDKYPSQISGGQRQRTAIARTLTLQPDLLLMDEPFSSLDAPTRESLQDLVLELWLEVNLTLIIVTHTIEEAAYIGRKILLLGQVPIQEARVIENPSASQTGYRESDAYAELVRQLRSRMGEE